MRFRFTNQSKICTTFFSFIRLEVGNPDLRLFLDMQQNFPADAHCSAYFCFHPEFFCICQPLCFTDLLMSYQCSKYANWAARSLIGICGCFLISDVKMDNIVIAVCSVVHCVYLLCLTLRWCDYAWLYLHLPPDSFLLNRIFAVFLLIFSVACCSFFLLKQLAFFCSCCF